MSETIQLGDLSIAFTRKEVKNVHLSVHPPDGRVTLVAPTNTRTEVARAYAASRLGWIRTQQAALAAQPREEPREFIGRETHYVWGRPHLLTIQYADAKPSVVQDHLTITLTVRPGSDEERRATVMHEWHKGLLHAVIPPLIERWEVKLGVKVAGYFLQRMKTKWGGCNPEDRHIRLNTELVKKPRELLEYVIVHEMVHLLEPTHSDEFVTLMNDHFPRWRDARAELNDLPLGAEEWNE